MSSMFTVYAGKASEVVIPARLMQITTIVTFNEYPAIKTRNPLATAPVKKEDRS